MINNYWVASSFSRFLEDLFPSIAIPNAKWHLNKYYFSPNDALFIHLLHKKTCNKISIPLKKYYFLPVFALLFDEFNFRLFCHNDVVIESKFHCKIYIQREITRIYNSIDSKTFYQSEWVSAYEWNKNADFTSNKELNAKQFLEYDKVFFSLRTISTFCKNASQTNWSRTRSDSHMSTEMRFFEKKMACEKKKQEKVFNMSCNSCCYKLPSNIYEAKANFLLSWCQMNVVIL